MKNYSGNTIKNEKNHENNYELSDIFINSRYFKRKIALNKILAISKSTDDIAIFIDEKILPEINEELLEYKNYLEIIDAINCLGVYGRDNKLKTNELKSFILIMTDLLYNNYNLNENFISLKNNEIKTKNRAIDFLNTINQQEIETQLKLKLLIDFVLNNFEKEKEVIKKSVMLSPEHIEKINQVEGKGFSAKVRSILDSYFNQNKALFVTEEELINRVNSNILEIYQKLKKEILSWNDEIEFKAINDYLIFSYYYRFLKLSLKKDKINLELSFSEDKPFEDYKNITRELKTKENKIKENKTKENKIKKLNFSLNNIKNLNYALFLIKQCYENNNQEIYSYTAYNHSIHKLFNDAKRYEYPFSEEIPKNGLFVLFEKGEKFQGENRITYIGSNIKKNRIPKMLNYIFKDGNRDNTSFRKNIGKSLLAKGDSEYAKKFKININSNIINLWNMDLKEFNEEYPQDSKENQEIENIENMVSQYIEDNFSCSIIELDKKLKRLDLKSKIISTLSLSDESKPSKEWLGYNSPREKIRKSGLWLEQHLGNRENQLSKDDVEFLKELAKEE
ncbi:MAG: DUF5655 domain-containing protein [Methanobrevibacter sp.]|nr:DUF5655 domain-containing protein [Methanobrevibacter sp.]